jgi:pyruvate/2-oxoglutarate dehydrogenase complex dihydrolipoamide acyltransferase (E2) component
MSTSAGGANVKKGVIVRAAVVLLAMAGAAQAQEPAAVRRAAAATQAAKIRSNLLIMEGVLERAVVLGAESLNRRVRALAPQDPPLLLAGEVDARGFRLDGYGVFFDVEVPVLRQSVAWSLRSLMDQGGVPLAVALNQLRAYVRAATDAQTRQSLERALHRLEMQVGAPDSHAVTQASAPSAPAPAAAAPEALEWLSNPNDAYTSAVKAALIDGMLEHSQALAIGPGEWLTVAARDNESRTRSVQSDDGATITLRVKGSDLAALHAGRITPEEARRRVEIREQ